MERAFAVGALVLLGLVGGRAGIASRHPAAATPRPGQGSILLRATSLQDPARRYRVVATVAGQVVERSTDSGAHWRTLLTPAFAAGAGTPAATPHLDPSAIETPGRSPVPGYQRAGVGRVAPGIAEDRECPAAYTAVRALTPARSGPDLYVATAGDAGNYLDGGCGSAIGGIFAFHANGVVKALGYDGLPFDQDPVGRTIRAYDVRGVVLDFLHSSVLYVQTGAGTAPDSPPPGLYKSVDAGRHWREIDAGLRPSATIRAFPGHPMHVYDPGTLRIALDHGERLQFHNDAGTYRSNDNPVRWSPIVPRRARAWERKPGRPTHPFAIVPRPAPTFRLQPDVQTTAIRLKPEVPLPAGWRWQRIDAAGAPPPPRQDAALAWDGAGRRLLVFGGTNTAANAAMGDLWAYSPNSNSWTRRAAGPPGRSGSAAAWDRRDGALLVFGGQTGRDTGARFFGDLWAYHAAGDRWSPLWRGETNGGPQARSHAVVTWDEARGRLLLFGGEISENPWRVSNDLWAFTPNREATGGTWTLLAAAHPGCTVTCPQPRASALGTWDPYADHLLLFGGRNDAQSVLSDTWTWLPRGRGGAWQQQERDIQPGGRTEGAMAFDAAHGAVIAGPGLSLTDGNVADAWADRATAGAWQPLPVAPAPLPPPRRLTAWAWDDASGRFLLFGGRITRLGAANDLWELAPSTPQSAPPPPPAHPLTAGLDEGWALDNEGRPIVSDAQIAATRRAGARYVRINFRLGHAHDWSDHALLAGYDAVVDRYRAAGIGVLGLVNQEATRSNQADWTANNRENGLGSGDNRFIATLYVQRALLPLLRHFHDRIATWELWNEPNVYRSCSGTVCTGGSFIYPSNFAALLRRSYTAVKDPAPAGLGLSEINLIAGGLLSHSIGGVLSPENAAAGYLRSTYETGISSGGWRQFAEAHAGRYPLDGLGQHLYIDQSLLTTRTDVTAYYRWLRESAARFGTPPPSYMTEGAWTTGILSQHTQAQDLDVLYRASSGTGFVPWTIWFELHDAPPIGGYYGLIEAAGGRKRSFRRYQGHAKRP